MEYVLSIQVYCSILFSLEVYLLVSALGGCPGIGNINEISLHSDLARPADGWSQ
jgi:hypothetical protein